METTQTTTEQLIDDMPQIRTLHEAWEATVTNVKPHGDYDARVSYLRAYKSEWTRRNEMQRVMKQRARQERKSA